MLCHGKEPIKSACTVFPLGHNLKVDCLPQAARHHPQHIFCSGGCIRANNDRTRISVV